MKKIFYLVFSCTLLHTFPLGQANIRSGYTPGKSCLSIQFKNEFSDYQITSVFLLPGEKTKMTIPEMHRPQTLSLSGAIDGWESISDNSWSVTAPQQTGIYPVRIQDSTTGDSILVNVFVMVPISAAKGGRLNGYDIGKYPHPGKDREAMYPLPQGFIEVTEENKNTFLTPHFRLGQFLCKQSGSYPKYVVLKERLLLKLEAVMEELNDKGIPCNSFTIMSGYRTPHYNRQLGNVKFSRHMWGDAADIFIDSEPGENYMADLNGDGRRDVRDGDLLFNAINKIEKEPEFAHYVGGLGKYKATSSHGPFVHVDARGIPNRWNNYE